MNWHNQSVTSSVETLGVPGSTKFVLYAWKRSDLKVLTVAVDCNPNKFNSRSQLFLDFSTTPYGLTHPHNSWVTLTSQRKTVRCGWKLQKSYFYTQTAVITDIFEFKVWEMNTDIDCQLKSSAFKHLYRSNPSNIGVNVRKRNKSRIQKARLRTR